METTVKLYSLTYNNAKTYLFALLFIVGNVALPQLCHLIPGGGPMLLPIYFFTLIAAYKYGMQVGLMTAILSPLMNSALFDMPTVAALPAILIKSGLLAIFCAYIANRSRDISLFSLFIAVLAYQIIGSAFEWVIVKDFYLAVQDFRIAIPGMLIQIFGGYVVLKALARI